MTRKLYPVLILVALTLAGCGKVNEFLSVKPDANCGEQSCAQTAEYVPEDIIHRNWTQAEIKPEPYDSIKPNPYVTGYTALDTDSPQDEYKTWSKSNAKRAVSDPVIFLKDIVTAPFKYSRDKYEEYKAKKQCEKCSSKCDAALDK